MRRHPYGQVRWASRLGAVLLGLALVLASTVVAAASEVELVFSEPAAGAVLAQAPKEVRLWFSEELADGSRVQIFDAQGKQVDHGDSGTCPDDPNHASLAVTLDPLAAGMYTAHWHAVLSNREASDGEFTFRVGEPISAAGEVGGAVSLVVWVVGAAGLGLVVLDMARGATRRSSPQT